MVDQSYQYFYGLGMLGTASETDWDDESTPFAGLSMTGDISGKDAFDKQIKANVDKEFDGLTFKVTVPAGTKLTGQTQSLNVHIKFIHFEKPVHDKYDLTKNIVDNSYQFMEYTINNYDYTIPFSHTDINNDKAKFDNYMYTFMSTVVFPNIFVYGDKIKPIKPLPTLPNNDCSKYLEIKYFQYDDERSPIAIEKFSSDKGFWAITMSITPTAIGQSYFTGSLELQNPGSFTLGFHIN